MRAPGLRSAISLVAFSTLLAVGALLEAGQGDEAGKQITESLRLNGPSAWTRKGLAQLATLRGASHESRRHTDLARAAWQNAEEASLPRL